eukprot:scaffold4004_cov105-Cylindrotheca_fusiformis.AAC.3
MKKQIYGCSWNHREMFLQMKHRKRARIKSAEPPKGRMLLREGSHSNDPSDIKLLANVAIPGVDISDLNKTSAQYISLEWLAYEDSRNLTIKDDATELLERFSVVTFYHSIGGESLDEEDSWDVDEVQP